MRLAVLGGFGSLISFYFLFALILQLALTEEQFYDALEEQLDVLESADVQDSDSVGSVVVHEEVSWPRSDKAPRMQHDPVRHCDAFAYGIPSPPSVSQSEGKHRLHDEAQEKVGDGGGGC